MKLLVFMWQFPQTLLALILLLYIKLTGKYSHSEVYKNKIVFWSKNTKWGVSLGEFIFMSIQYHNNITVAHEYGHCVQSLLFGPLYLLIIGLPSISMNILSIILFLLGNRKFSDNYYYRWPENWADTLGGVDRKNRKLILKE